MTWRGAALLLLAYLALPNHLGATPVCEALLDECIHDAEVELAACVQEPNPPSECEGNYQVARDQCDADYYVCEDGQQGCSPCSSPYYTTNEALCGGNPEWDNCGCCVREESPIIIDLGGDGVRFSNAQDGVRFSLAASHQDAG
jgi:hypothetical protein